MVAVLFVCLGNICRSPAAEGILLDLDDEHVGKVESCAIGSWHVGELPDARMRDAAQQRGLTLASKAQQIQPHHFHEFDYILAMDHEVLQDLYHMAKPLDHKAKIHLFGEFGKRYKGCEIPDPYYGGDAGFYNVLDMLEDCCQGFLEHLHRQQSR